MEQQNRKTRALLQTYVHRTIDPSHDAWEPLLAIMASKPQWQHKLDNISAFRITRSRLNKALLLQVKLSSASRRRWYTVSWRQTTAPPDPLQSAFRHAIKHQIKTWRKSNYPLSAVCAQCGDHHSLQVDHKEPQFIELTHTFLSKPENQQTIPTTFAYHKAGRKFLPKDKNFKLRWQRYHHKHANLQWLCRTCNLQKTKAKINTSSSAQ